MLVSRADLFRQTGTEATAVHPPLLESTSCHRFISLRSNCVVMVNSGELENRFRKLRTSLDALPNVSEPPKSTLRILGSARSEQTWNTLLAYFLDPTQPHGFGTDLLTSFLNNVQQQADPSFQYYYRHLENIMVETEVISPDNNRPDVVLRSSGDWFLCIESKVDSTEGDQQTIRYVEDTHIGDEKKATYPEGGHHYVFLSKRYTPDSNASKFGDLYWHHVVESFETVIERSHGRYPERSVSQLREFLSTITQVTNMEHDDFTEIQKEKVQLLSEYRSNIDTLLDAAESLRQRSIEDWPELFNSHVDDDLWTDDWHTRPEHGKWGCLFKNGWYLDNDDLEPTIDQRETHGQHGFRLHFVHLIRDEESFSRGKLTLILRSPTRVDMRDEFNRLYNSQRYQSRIKPILTDAEITNKGQKKNYTQKTYDVDQSGLPESYFETLATAFAEHQPLADVVDEILDEAVDNVH